MFKAFSFAVVGALALASVPASSSITFDFSSGTGSAYSYDYASGGVDLTVTGGQYENGSISSWDWVQQNHHSGYWDYAQVTRSSSGLGVDLGKNDQGWIDGGAGTDDVLIFNFSQEVRIVSVVFGNADNSDDFRLFGDEFGLIGEFELSGSHHDRATFTFSGDWVTDQLAFGAIREDDKFRILALNIETVTPSIEVPGSNLVSGIPEPSTWLMVILGFGVTIGAARRRTRKRMTVA